MSISSCMKLQPVIWNEGFRSSRGCHEKLGHKILARGMPAWIKFLELTFKEHAGLSTVGVTRHEMKNFNQNWNKRNQQSWRYIFCGTGSLKFTLRICNSTRLLPGFASYFRSLWGLPYMQKLLSRQPAKMQPMLFCVFRNTWRAKKCIWVERGPVTIYCMYIHKTGNM